MSYFFKGPNGEETKKNTSEIFKVGSNFPNTKVITFDGKKDAFDLTLMYTHPEKLLKGLPPYIAHYSVNEGHPVHEKFSFILRVSNNIHNIAHLESAEIQEEWEEAVQIPVKKQIKITDKAPETDKKKKGDKKGAAEEEKQEEAK